MTSKKDEIHVKIGSKDEAYWTRVKEQSEKLINDGRNEIIINERILALAIEKIALEKETFK